jgi:predicted anti-sigma-YlaC factor YlaD
MGVVNTVIPARCERSREWSSLRLDGMLSVFESALLDRHLRRCAGCRDFADATATHTELLRGALPEEPSRRVAVPTSSARRRRRTAVGAALVAAVSAVAAVFTLVPGTHRSTHATRVSARDTAPALVVFPAKPTPGSRIEVPRLRVQPASIADGPVRGAYFTRPSV